MYLKKLLLQLNPHGQCLGYRPAPKQPYRFLTYTEVFQHARDFGCALITKVGLTPGTLNRIWIEQSNIPSIRLFFLQKSIIQVGNVLVLLHYPKMYGSKLQHRKDRKSRKVTQNTR